MPGLSQMAGFVGNHECVAVINNYVGKEEVYFYTRKQPLETEPKLSLQLAKPIHQLVQTVTRIHEIPLCDIRFSFQKIVLFVQFFTNSAKIKYQQKISAE